MESYQLVMFFLLFVFHHCYYLLAPFLIPNTSPWQPPINDVHINDGNQSWWCSSQFNIVHTGGTRDSVDIRITEAYLVLFFYLVSLIANLQLPYYFTFRRRDGTRPPIDFTCFLSVLVWILTAGLVRLIYLYIYSVTSLVPVSTCVPVEADVLLLSVWSNSEWNSTDAWLKHANMSSVGAAETIHSWVMGASISCFVGYTVVIILINIDYDPEGEEEEPPEAPAIPIDTD